MSSARYDGLADAHDAFVDVHSPYSAVAADALRRLLGAGRGRCLDLGCGGGHFTSLALELGWTVVAVDASQDQLRIARRRLPQVELVRADAGNLPFADESFDAAFSTCTGNLETGTPRLHPGYRRGGRWNAADAPGATPQGWRVRLGSFVHVPLGDFLSAFTGFTLDRAEELDDGSEYPKTFALALRRP